MNPLTTHNIPKRIQKINIYDLYPMPYQFHQNITQEIYPLTMKIQKKLPQHSLSNESGNSHDLHCYLMDSGSSSLFTLFPHDLNLSQA